MRSRPDRRGRKRDFPIGSRQPSRLIRTRSQPAARSFTSTGCFRSASQLRTSCRPGGDTLAANYQTLTGKTTAYQDLVAAVNGLSVISDNPFVGPIQLFYRGADNGVYSRWRNVDGTWSGE